MRHAGGRRKRAEAARLSAVISGFRITGEKCTACAAAREPGFPAAPFQSQASRPGPPPPPPAPARLPASAEPGSTARPSLSAPTAPPKTGLRLRPRGHDQRRLRPRARLRCSVESLPLPMLPCLAAYSPGRGDLTAREIQGEVSVSSRDSIQPSDEFLSSGIQQPTVS